MAGSFGAVDVTRTAPTTDSCAEIQNFRSHQLSAAIKDDFRPKKRTARRATLATVAA
jgi:hypothetical protein